MLTYTQILEICWIVLVQYASLIFGLYLKVLEFVYLWVWNSFAYSFQFLTTWLQDIESFRYRNQMWGPNFGTCACHTASAFSIRCTPTKFLVRHTRHGSILTWMCKEYEKLVAWINSPIRQLVYTWDWSTNQVHPSSQVSASLLSTPQLQAWQWRVILSFHC